MKQIKIIFEADKGNGIKRFGYILNSSEGVYTSCQFDENYNALDVAEQSSIGDPMQFGQKIARLLKYAIEEKNK